MSLKAKVKWIFKETLEYVIDRGPIDLSATRDYRIFEYAYIQGIACGIMWSVPDEELETKPDQCTDRQWENWKRRVEREERGERENATNALKGMSKILVPGFPRGKQDVTAMLDYLDRLEKPDGISKTTWELMKAKMEGEDGQ